MHIEKGQASLSRYHGFFSIEIASPKDEHDGFYRLIYPVRSRFSFLGLLPNTVQNDMLHVMPCGTPYCQVIFPYELMHMNVKISPQPLGY